MLETQNREVQQNMYVFLQDVLSEVKQAIADGEIYLLELVDSMVLLSWNENLNVRLEAVTWIFELFEVGGTHFFAKYPEAIKATLHCLSDEKAPVVATAQKVNSSLLNSISAAYTECERIDFESIMETLITNMEHPSNTTKLAVLQ